MCLDPVILSVSSNVDREDETNIKASVMCCYNYEGDITVLLDVELTDIQLKDAASKQVTQLGTKPSNGQLLTFLTKEKSTNLCVVM